MTASLLLSGIFLWLTVSVVMAPIVGWALHRQNQRHSWDDSYDRLTRGMQ